MTGAQVGAAVALAVIGVIMIAISAISRDGLDSLTPFGDHLSKLGLFVGGFFLLPLVLMLIVSIVAGGVTQ